MVGSQLRIVRTKWGKTMCGINSTSKNAQLVVTGSGRVLGVLSWDGFHPQTAPRRKVSEDDVLAQALFLEKHGKPDEALALLDDYCG